MEFGERYHGAFVVRRCILDTHPIDVAAKNTTNPACIVWTVIRNDERYSCYLSGYQRRVVDLRNAQIC